MKILQLMIGASVISSLTPGVGHTMEEASKAQTSDIQCPKLTKSFILQHRDDFSFPTQRGGYPLNGIRLI